MSRERLPDRRQSETVDLWHGGRRYHLGIGEYPDGKPGETFVRGAKPGSDTDLLCDDIGVLISRLLQHGDDPAALAAGIGRLGGGDPASIVGAIADVLAARPLVERRKGREKWKSWWQRFRKARATKSVLR